ncbi:amino acid adenylation domain-containing protein [Dactylosporangium aurantiacum]|uniref:Amino acid adenylation domain-containing protein n=1 Tax=Dactylosporangium aurantiacum TaxID=35754 RepID=A0A9Q9MIJ0_9ACTN|nr:non-ribosomal peptide synthetase [Dactylosporangium aurantiacum]MDG6106862.1 non-ribosomal peptide synthetase [Dactylosporangium aurantiacum]UWZ50997.1 amino acid adenylation domain-containing protein [Dactylosporangium aurantiacum]
MSTSTSPGTGPAPVAADVRALMEQRLARLTAGPPAPAIPRGDGPRPASPAQQRLLFLEQLHPGTPTYHVIFTLRIDGPLDADALEASLRGVEQRHEILRTTYRRTGDGEEQVTGPVGLRLRRVDLPGAADARLDELARDEYHRPFDLREGPVWRAVLARTAADRHHLVLTLHHVAFDGWSVDVLARELSAGYAAALGDGPAPAAPPVQYADYAAWQVRRLAAGGFDRQLAYWTGQLAGAAERLELPSPGPGPAAAGAGGGGRVRGRVPADVTAAVRAAARAHGATAHVVLLAALHALLHRYSGQRDILVGTPVANRALPELEPLVGLFVNTVVVRADVEPRLPFATLLERVRDAATAAQAHQDVPFERVVAALPLARDTDANPLFQVVFDWNSSAARTGTTVRLGAARMTLVERFRPDTAKFDLAVSVSELPDGLEVELEYRRDLWDEPAARRAVRHYLNLLAAAAADPSLPVERLPLLDPAERALVTDAWQGPVQAHTDRPDLTARIAARRDSDAVALVQGGRHVTYRELAARVDRLAAHLRAAGAAPDRPVGVLLHRGIDLVVAIVAIVRSGAPYLPLDPDHPAERTGTVVRDAGAALVVTDRGLAGTLDGTGATPVCLDAEADRIAARPDRCPDPDIQAEHLAYVFYTSGSTGRPKGVMVSHRAAHNQVHWQVDRFALGPGATVLFKTNVTFDDSVVEIFAALSSGARLVIAEPGGHRDPAYLRSLLAAERVTYVRFVPTMLAALLAYGGDTPLPALRVVKSAGEALTPELRARFLGSLGAELYNAYGPTETAVNVTADRCRLDGDPRVPIGAATTNVRCYVLDAALQPQPVGVPGELCVGGVQLARGYLGRPGLTADRFVPDPFGPPGGRLYRTGDLVRWRDDGRIDFLGRLDRQVKLRGFRVELGEVEAVLTERVRHAAVVARDGRLVAYVTGTADTAPDTAELRAWLRSRLPEYMVPAAIVPLPALPQLSSGKVDYRRLPDPPDLTPDRAGYTAPQGPVEQELAALWSEVLGAGRVGRDDDFFALGGHSILAVRLLSRVRQTFGVDAPLRWVFDAPTPARFAPLLDRAAAGPPLPPVPAATGPVPELSAAEAGLWLVDQLHPADPSYVVPVVSRLRGPLDAGALGTALTALPRRHDALRTAFTADGGEPRRVVADHADVTVHRHDLRHLPAADRDAALARLVGDVTGAGFDLAEAPLMRAALIAVAADEHVLALAFHHAVVDAWSLNVLHDDLVTAYEAAAAGRPQPPAPARRTAADYARWQRGLAGGDRLEAELAYWRDRLRELPAAPELPADRPRPATPDPAGSVHRFTVPAPVATALRDLAAAEGGTPFMVLLAAYVTLLHRWTGSDDVVLAMPVADRARPELEHVVGMLLNTVLLRVRVRGTATFRQLVHDVRTAVVEAYEHRQLPFARLVEALRLDAAALTRCTVTIDQPPAVATLAGGVTLHPEPFVPTSAKAELNLSFEDGPGGLAGSLLYQTARFDAGRVARTAGHLSTLLAGAVAAPDTPLERLDLLDAAQREALTGDEPADRPSPTCLHTLVGDEIARRPDAVALLSRAGAVTYRQLGERAAALAARLRARGVRAGHVVAIALPRGAEQVVAVLAVLRTGAAYVALDLRHPEARRAAVLRDSGAHSIVTDGLTVRRLDPAAPALAGDGRPRPRSVAYLAYTSGSTGTPKGVRTPHAAAAGYLTEYLLPTFRLGPGDTVLQLPALAFDASVRDLIGPLAAGARVVLLTDDQATDPAAILDAVDREGVTCLLSVVPTLLRSLLAEAASRPGTGPRLRLLLTAGEVLDRHDAARARALFAGRPAVVNQYGPTEATMTTTWHPVDAGPGERGGVPIGRPAPGARVWLVDAAGDLAATGVPGEVWIGGDRLADGYHGRPALTAERFVPDPFSGVPGARAYRTGDTAVRDPDGVLHFLGRGDGQVKIRGNRVEPGEVEAVLRGLPGVAEAAVVATGTPARLAAFVAPGTLDVAAVQAALRELLPEPMVPATLHAMAALPRTTNQKVDRKALAAVPLAPPVADPPRTDAERRVAAVFHEVLRTELPHAGPVGRDEDFFTLGGHSLLAARLAAALGAAFGRAVPLRSVFDLRTVAAIAAAVATAPAPATSTVERAGDGRPTPAQTAMVRHRAAGAAYHIGFAAWLDGAVDTVALARAVDAVVARHPALRTTFTADGGHALVEPVLPAAITVRDATADADAVALAEADLRRPFDLTAGPLVRATVTRTAAGRHLFAVAVHHAVADGWSLSVIQRDIAAYYTHLTGGGRPALPTVAGFAAHAAGRTGDLAFWDGLLRDVPVDVTAAPDRPRAGTWSTAGAVHRFTLPAELSRAVRAMADATGATTFMVLLAAVQLWLARQSGAGRFLVAVPVADRPAAAQHEVGPFANVVPVPADVTGAPTPRELVARVRGTMLAVWEHQDTPFEVLADRYDPAARAGDRPPLCRFMFAVQNLPPGADTIPGLRLEPVDVDRGTCRYDLHLRCRETPDGISGWIEYSTALYDAATVRRRLADLFDLLGALTDGTEGA